MVLVYKRGAGVQGNWEFKRPSYEFKDLDEHIKTIGNPPISSCDMDLVYIVKPGEINLDLRYSLRSVAKFCPYRKVWIVGFKPRWVQNVCYLPTTQDKDKWKNSVINYTAACKCKDVSDNFVLMNDDFFAIKPVTNWYKNTNLCLGELSDFAEKFGKLRNRSKWQWAFSYAISLLKQLNSHTSYNYEAHTPLIINKKSFLEMLNLQAVADFQTTKKVFHKRSIFENLYPQYKEKPRQMTDVKIEVGSDVSQHHLEIGWISTYDGMLKNPNYPRLDYLLNKLFLKPSKFEKL